jgi:hypothetical protein
MSLPAELKRRAIEARATLTLDYAGVRMSDPPYPSEAPLQVKAVRLDSNDVRPLRRRLKL